MKKLIYFLVYASLVACFAHDGTSQTIHASCYVLKKSNTIVVVNKNPEWPMIAIHAEMYYKGKFVWDLILDDWKNEELMQAGGYRTYASQLLADTCKIDGVLFADYDHKVEGPNKWDLFNYHIDSKLQRNENHFPVQKNSFPDLVVPPTINGWVTFGYYNGAIAPGFPNYICALNYPATGGPTTTVECEGGGDCLPQPNLFLPGKTQVAVHSSVTTICAGAELNSDGYLKYTTFQGNPHYEVAYTDATITFQTGLVANTSITDSCVANPIYVPIQIINNCGGSAGGCDPPVINRHQDGIDPQCCSGPNCGCGQPGQPPCGCTPPAE